MLELRLPEVPQLVVDLVVILRRLRLAVRTPDQLVQQRIYLLHGSLASLESGLNRRLRLRFALLVVLKLQLVYVLRIGIQQLVLIPLLDRGN